MDQAFSMVIVALITGVFSVITLVIQKKQEKVINKINEQTTFIEKEKVLKQQLTEKEKEREALIHSMMILILDTNLEILRNTDAGQAIGHIDAVMTESQNIKTRFESLTTEIAEIRKEYNLILNLTNEITKQIKDQASSKKK